MKLTILACLLLCGCSVSRTYNPGADSMSPIDPRRTEAAMTYRAVVIPAGVAVSLAWSEMTELGVAGYKVYWGITKLDYTNAVMVGNVTNTTINGFRLGQEYHFAISAYNEDFEESDYSDEVVGTPEQIQILRVPAYTNSTAAIDGWQLSHYIFTGTNVQGSGFWKLSDPVIEVNTVWK